MQRGKLRPRTVYPTVFAPGALRCSCFVVQVAETDETVLISLEEITFK